jgi:Mu-like prophage I protein
METHLTVQAPDALSLSADSLLLPNNTLWSHAATLGNYTQGTEFTLDKETIGNIVRIFHVGHRPKVPVDYEHGSTDPDPAVAQARAMGKVPKAGDVKELRGVFSVDDFTDDLKVAATKLAAKVGRSLDDPRNFGLWMRWEPTAKALQSIQAREHTELSVTFLDHWIKDGVDYGYALLAVALTNIPFLPEMLPIAASQTSQPATRSAPPPDAEDRSMKNLLQLVGQVAGVPVNTEDEGVTRLTAVSVELTRLREQNVALSSLTTKQTAALTALTQELDEPDAEKAVDRVRSLKAENKRHADAVAAEKKKRIDGQVAETMKRYEGIITPFQRDEYYAKHLRAELENGVELDKSATIKVLNDLPQHGITTRSSGADAGGEALGSDMDERLDRVALSLMESEPDLKQLAATDRDDAYRQALRRAAKQIGYKSQQMRIAHANA